MNTRRVHHSMFATKEHVFVFGGFMKASHSGMIYASDEVEVCSNSDGVWSKCEPMINGLAQMAVCRDGDDGSIYLVGGTANPTIPGLPPTVEYRIISGCCV